MYRAVALAALREGIDPDDAARLTAIARRVRIAIGPPTLRDGRAYTLLLDGVDVTWEIRGDQGDRNVSQGARVPGARGAVGEQQRGPAPRGRIGVVGPA